jgi:hypothetical protein
MTATRSSRASSTLCRAPNANAHLERWVGTAGRECLDRLLIVGRRQLAHVCAFTSSATTPETSPRTRPETAGLDDPLTYPNPRNAALTQVDRRDLLGGLIHEYELAA